MTSQFYFHHLWSSPLLDQKGRPVDELEVDKERKMIESILKKSGIEINFRSAVATSKEFQMEASNCDIAHFSGHGLDGLVALEHRCEPYTDDIGKMDILSADELKLLCNEAQFKPKLVFVSACHSEKIGNTFVEIGVQHVVAIRKEFPVLDDASRTFATTFYEGLIKYGYSVSRAFNVALSDIKKIFPEEKDKFLLLPTSRDGCSADDDDASIADHKDSVCIHDVTLNIPKRRGSMQNLSEKSPNGNHKLHTTNMIGRHEYAIDIYKKLHQTPNKIIMVTGPPKIGKTEVVLRALSYSFARSEFEDYFMIEASKYELMEGNQFLWQLCHDLCKLQLQHSTHLSSSSDAELGGGGGGVSSSSSSSFSLANQIKDMSNITDVDELVTLFANQCAEKTVLLLDGFDIELHPELSSLLDNIVRQKANKNLRIVLTAVKSDNSCDIVKSEIPVKGLTPEETALLFCSRACRPLSKLEIFSPGVSQYRCSEIQAFSQHPLIVCLEGHPLATIKTASHITTEDMGSGGESNELLRKESIFLKHACDYVEQCQRLDTEQKKDRRKANQLQQEEVNQQQQEQQGRNTGGGGGSNASGASVESLAPLLKTSSISLRSQSSSSSLSSSPRSPHALPIPPPSAVAAVSNITSNGEDLSKYQWWHPCLTRNDSKRVIGKTNGTFLIRPSSKKGCYALDVIISNKFLPLLIETLPNNRVKLIQPKEKTLITNLGGKDYRTLNDLVTRNMEFLKFPLKQISYLPPSPRITS